MLYNICWFLPYVNINLSLKKNRICEEFANCISPILLDFLSVPISSNAEILARRRKGEYNFFHVFAIPLGIIFAAIGSSIWLLLAYTEQALLFPCSSQLHWLSGGLTSKSIETSLWASRFSWLQLFPFVPSVLGSSCFLQLCI